MLNKLTLKSKLLIPIFGLISVIFLLATLIIIFNYKKTSSLSNLRDNVILSNYVSDTITSIQRERGLSSGYITDKITFKVKLIKQRQDTDKSVEALFTFINTKYLVHNTKLNKDITNSFKDIKLIRKKVNNDTLTYNAMLKEYSTIINLLLKYIVDIAKNSNLPQITQNLSAYVNLLYLKESIGSQRALGVKILSLNKISADDRINMIKLISKKEQSFLMFSNYASNDISKYYIKIAKIDTFKKIKNIENYIINKNSLDIKISSSYWYDITTKKINSLNRIGKYIKIKTLKHITHELTQSKRVFVFMLLLILLSMITFSLMLMALLKLIKEEQKLRAVLDRYTIVSITDLKGVITDVSDAFCDISGYSKSELIGKNHNLVRHPSMEKEVFQEIWRRLKKGESWKGKIKNLKNGGGFYWVYANIEPLYNSAGEVDAYISVRVDITESELLQDKIKEEESKNKMQEKLMQQQHRMAQMGEMISMIAHQWRQPLNAITAASGVIQMKVKLNKLDSQTAIALSEKIQGFSNHLSTTIDDFRDFFKPNKAQTQTNFKKIVDGVLQISESSLTKYNINVIQDINSIDNFITYENELKQVLLNLIKNAEDIIVEKSIKNPEIK